MGGSGGPGGRERKKEEREKVIQRSYDIPIHLRRIRMS